MLGESVSEQDGRQHGGRRSVILRGMPFSIVCSVEDEIKKIGSRIGKRQRQCLGID